MNDIEPWLNGDVPPDIAESLHAARAEAPRRVALERCIAVIGTAGAVGLTASAASAASYGGGKAVGLAALVKWGLTGVAAGTLLTGGIEIARRMTAPSPMPSAVLANVTVRSVPSAPNAKPAPVVAPPPAPSAKPPAAHLPAPNVASAPSVDERLAAELAL